MAEYLVELPPKGLLEAKLHEAIRLATGQVEAREEMQGDEILRAHAPEIPRINP